jgi:hypothetical protein
MLGRRDFLKGLAALPVVGTLFQGKKADDHVVKVRKVPNTKRAMVHGAAVVSDDDDRSVRGEVIHVLYCLKRSATVADVEPRKAKFFVTRPRLAGGVNIYPRDDSVLSEHIADELLNRQPKGLDCPVTVKLRYMPPGTSLSVTIITDKEIGRWSFHNSENAVSGSCKPTRSWFSRASAGSMEAKLNPHICETDMEQNLYESWSRYLYGR